MPAFSLTPITGFPPPTADDFPTGLQFQDEGVNLGDTNEDTVNFVGAGVTATRSAAVVTVTIPGGGGGGGEDTLTIFLNGAATGFYDNTLFTNWVLNTLISASSRAAWSAPDQAINITDVGVYEVIINGAVDATGIVPTTDTQYGSGTDQNAFVDQSRHYRPSGNLLSFNARWTDRHIVEVASAPLLVKPQIYAIAPGESTSEATFGPIIVTVRRLGDIAP